MSGQIDRKLACLLAACFVTCLLVAPAQAQRQLKDIPPPDPELERQTFEVADGFEVNLFASDPQIAKPIQINFDADGRLWIASSSTYPHIEPGAKAVDKVLFVEDIDGDGTADRTNVFAEGLLIPTGLEPGDGGVYVANSTELLHLSDSDGDGKADQRRVMLSGFGTEDTHHILHTLRWGNDGALYMNQSIYIHSHVETPHGVRRLGGGGIWRFRPETLDLDVLMRGLCNPWGHHFDEWGQSFATDGAGGEGINFVVPGAYYFTAPGAARTLPGLNPGSPKHCGAEIVSGRHLPDDWQGNILTNDFRANRVCRFVLRDDGSGFASHQQPELIRSTHVGFRPVDIKQGPDGAIYIADWYNPIIQHGEVDFRDPRRDHTHGRIWRVTAKGRPLVPRVQLTQLATPELVAELASPEGWTRHFAKRVLKERRGTNALLPSLAAWVAGLDPADPRREHHQLEALWMYESLDLPQAELVKTLLAAKTPEARAAAVRVVGHWHARLPDCRALLAPVVADVHPRVRLEAVRALALLNDWQSTRLALTALGSPQDRFLDYAEWLIARETAGTWLAALDLGELDFGSDTGQLLFALEAVDSPAVVGPLMRLWTSGRIASEFEDRALALIARTGGPNELRAVLDLVLKPDSAVVAGGARARLLELLAGATKSRQVRPAGDLSATAELLSASDESLVLAATHAAGGWQLPNARSTLTERARSDAAPPTLRNASIDALAELGGPESVAACVELAAAPYPADVRRQAVIALTPLDAAAAAQAAVGWLNDSAATSDPTMVVQAILARKEGPAALAAALGGHKIPEDVAKLALRIVRSGGRDLGELVTALAAAGSLTGGPRQLSPDELSAWVAEVAAQGDAARGEAIFRREEQACLKCHAIGGAGGRVGPDLASIGASAQIDYLIESLLVPSKAVKENYHSISVSTDDGKLLTGLLVRESDTELVLRNSEDQEVAIPLATVEERAQAGSIMPEGLADTLTKPEILDLVRFLSSLGKPGVYAVSPARLARRWQTLAKTRAAEKLLKSSSFAAATEASEVLKWQGAYSRVDGSLPMDCVPGLATRPEHPLTGFARAELEASTAGPVRLVLGDASGLKLWLDGNELTAGATITLDLSAGRHMLTVALDKLARQNSLALELLDEPGSPAEVQWVSGK